MTLLQVNRAKTRVPKKVSVRTICTLIFSVLTTGLISLEGRASGGAAHAQQARVVEGATTSVPSPAPAPDRIVWKPCANQPGADCANLGVPLDYSRPNDRSIDIALLRVRATGKPIGSLLVNPGGPGSSGVDFAARAGRLFGSSIRQKFDIIGFDPRGVGRSQAIDCLSDARMDAYLGADPSPDNDAERLLLRSVSKELADGCASRVGVDVMRHLGTFDAARDMEQIRRALGEETISMMGFSYGTLLGATYAELFPKRVRAFVLDGALDSLASSDDRARIQAQGFEETLQAYAAGCSKRDSCTGRLAADPIAAVDAILESVESAPLAVGRRVLGPGEALLGVVRGMYSQRSGWPRLDAALRDALVGKGGALLAMSDDYSNRDPRGRFDGLLEANALINCVDVASNRDPMHYDRLAVELAKISPRFGPGIAYGALPCAYWATDAVSTGWRTKATGAPPILVVGTTNDPATPYVWAEQMAKQLSSGVLLTNRGDYHTAYFAGGRCVRSAIERYLVSLRVPKRGTVC
jgi:pimeloyl-ACP methyl ester carboxylesterase